MARRFSSRLREAQSEILARGESLRFNLTGTSMFPVLREGDVVDVAQGRYCLGDILAYRSGGRLLAHRLVSRDSTGAVFVLRGDTHRRNDPLVDRRVILGRVVAVERAGVSLDLQSPWHRAWSRFAAWTVGGEAPFAMLCAGVRSSARWLRRSGRAFVATSG